MQTPRIGFIGGGNMCASLVGGLIADDWPAGQILIAEPDAARCGTLAAQFGVQCQQDNRAVAAQVAVLVLAVKPQVLHAVCRDLADVLPADCLVLSIAAGVRETDIRQWLGGERAIVRSMPNTPALVQSGATGLYANPWVSEAQKETAENILRAVGITRWLESEAELDAVTALSGSGPAYFFLVIEALEEAAMDLGLSQETANLLALQTAFGAAKMALESDEPAAVLRQRVTSPGGTTERALQVLEQGGLRQLFNDALKAAAKRAEELGEMLGKSE